ncbi:unnamed protein product [Anisakis simplex]|uniref:Transmembrane protein n=1 Tax=Anisakis simplex TaxID=6269 RepID=A0A0M3JB80_ANISI|nr:unnamed protein product [Anisakis simplex]
MQYPYEHQQEMRTFDQEQSMIVDDIYDDSSQSRTVMITQAFGNGFFATLFFLLFLYFLARLVNPVHSFHVI